MTKYVCSKCGIDGASQDRNQADCPRKPECSWTIIAAPSTELTTWEIWTYDVWGNAKDGYEVNDRWRTCQYELMVPIETANAGTPQAFTHAYPTDAQIRRAFGIRCRFETDGDDLTIYVNRKRDGYPIGEMHCTSHDNLSPIRRKAAEVAAS